MTSGADAPDRGPGRAEALFVELHAIPPARRQQVLQAACAGDEALRRQVEALLEAHGRPLRLLRDADLAPLHRAAPAQRTDP
ncbi:MAG: hypothetical protein AB7O97_07415 [Planctomycetota bacterium]